MKLSVIFGVIHMSIGIIQKGSNAIFFRRWADLFTEVITGLFILIGLFGFMDILIYGKWFKELDIQDKTIINQDVLFDKLSQDVEGVPQYKGDYQNEHTPSIINIMINIVFNGGSYPPEQKDYVNLVGEDQDQQYSIGLTLLVIIAILVPVMLFAKPVLFRTPPPQGAEGEIELQNQQRNSARSDNSASKSKSNIKSIK
jgi:V-type H+-transporting ATPase subunit a